ncbi:MAG: GNAT family N-acetyltransferase [Clostridia bacterium]|nr:GNAT family N-acetyltransferase [Clostridia bacterium]
MHIIKIWHEKLFKLSRNDLVAHSARVPIELVPISAANAEPVKSLRGAEYEAQFLRHVALGDFGYYAVKDGVPVGYGWVKHEGSDDYFFKIGAHTDYLCRFFVREEERGQGIYPALITALIEREAEVDTFYIAVERGNESSERGLLKVGFKPVCEKSFLRVLKLTLNKKKIR